MSDYGLEVGGFWGSVWGVFKKAVKVGLTVVGGPAGSKVADVLNKAKPGAGTALVSGMKLINSAKKGDKGAVAQVVAIATTAKAEGASEGAKKAAWMLSMINEAHNENTKDKTEAAAVGAWVKPSTTKLDW